MRTVTAIMALAIVFIFVSEDSIATTFTVTDQSELADAFLNAADGDTVLIAPGSYGVSPPFYACITVKGMTGDPEDVILDIWDGLGQPVASTSGEPVRLEDLKCLGYNSGHSLLGGSNLAIEIRNCIIYGFAPVLSGGVIRADSAAILLENTVFEFNIGADGRGGAFHLTDCEVTAQDCTFTRNMSNISGGVFYMVGGDLDIADCSFLTNTGIEGGGALELTGVSGNIDNCSFIDNQTLSGGSGLKLLDCPDLTLSGSTINNNLVFEGSYGGMMILGSSVITLDDCVVGNNQAESPADGYLAADSSVVFRCCELDLTQWQLEGTAVIDNEDCSVANEQHSFGSLKAMFR